MSSKFSLFLRKQHNYYWHCSKWRLATRRIGQTHTKSSPKLQFDIHCQW